MTDDKRPQDIEQIKNEEGERITAYNMDGLLTFAGQPLHFDPETGEPIIEEMTAEQREQPGTPSGSHRPSLPRHRRRRRRRQKIMMRNPNK